MSLPSSNFFSLCTELVVIRFFRLSLIQFGARSNNWCHLSEGIRGHSAMRVNYNKFYWRNAIRASKEALFERRAAGVTRSKPISAVKYFTLEGVEEFNG